MQLVSLPHPPLQSGIFVTLLTKDMLEQFPLTTAFQRCLMSRHHMNLEICFVCVCVSASRCRLVHSYKTNCSFVYFLHSCALRFVHDAQPRRKLYSKIYLILKFFIP